MENMMREELEKAKKNRNFRTLKTYSRDMINFSSNDYLNLSDDLELKKNFFNFYNNLSFSSGSSRLITGSYSLIMQLEERLNSIYNKEALQFNSGFDANSCLIETLFNKNSLIISDKLNHSSIYSGIVASGAKLLRYKHLNVNHLESLHLKYSNDFKNILVITETIFSMDGDCCNLKEIIELKNKYSFKLMVDEAHTYGVYGYGLAYSLKLLPSIDYLSIPLGKGGASIGAYLLTDSITKEYIINKGKKFIYTTALPPINTAWNIFILENMENFYEKIVSFKSLIDFTINYMSELKIKTESNSHIISILFKDNLKVDRVVSNLIKKNYIVHGIKEPTVPIGTSRIRVSLNLGLTKENIRCFLEDLNNEINNIF